MRNQPPAVSTGEIDITVEDMKVTVAEFYRRLGRRNGAAENVALETDLADLFIAQGEVLSAPDFFRRDVRPGARAEDSSVRQLAIVRIAATLEPSRSETTGW